MFGVKVSLMTIIAVSALFGMFSYAVNNQLSPVKKDIQLVQAAISDLKSGQAKLEAKIDKLLSQKP